MAVKFDYSNDRQELICRCRVFWNREQVDKPMIGYLYNRRTPLSSLTDSRNEEYLRAEDITIETFLSDCEQRYRAGRKIGGDAVFVACPYTGMPWLEAIMGCRIKSENGVGWAEPLDSDWKGYNEGSVPWDNGWHRAMTDQTAEAIRFSHGKYPVGPPHLRGPGDVAPR